MKWTLEVIMVPVTDVDRSKEFYAEKFGFVVDHDTKVGDDVRIVQLTPPGSGCSVVISKGMSAMEPGTLKGVQLVVGDIHAAHAQLNANGIDTGPVIYAGREGFRPAEPGDDLNNTGFLFFDDPDGNSWAVQQITARGTS